MELGIATPRPPVVRRRAPDPPPRERVRRLRRIALVAAVVMLVPALFSYLHTISEPSNSSLGIRSVEWLRDHGAAGIVSEVESIYYSLTAPSKGGPTLKALPQVGYGAAAERLEAQRLAALELPRRVSRRCSIRRWRARESGEPLGPERRPTPPLLVTHAAQPARIPARGRGARLDQHQTHEDHAEPWPARAVGVDPARLDGRAAGEPRHAAGDLQQRLQAERLARRLRRSTGTPTRRCRTDSRRSSAIATAAST